MARSVKTGSLEDRLSKLPKKISEIETVRYNMQHIFPFY